MDDWHDYKWKKEELEMVRRKKEGIWEKWIEMNKYCSF
jgi:hypothetical protein